MCLCFSNSKREIEILLVLALSGFMRDRSQQDVYILRISGISATVLFSTALTFLRTHVKQM